jgi:hypothetical protein
MSSIGTPRDRDIESIDAQSLIDFMVSTSWGMWQIYADPPAWYYISNVTFAHRSITWPWHNL